jgi:uncharacterized protein involved in exopolysaccharide biosynthesis
MMVNDQRKSDDFDSSNLVVFLYKWRKPLFIVILVALFGSWFFSCSWFITPKFKSTVVMFPASSNSVSQALLSDRTQKGQDITSFGEDEQAEQLLQILNSSRIRGRIIRDFDLMKHYDVDSASPSRNSILFREYERNINFRRTEFMAVKITVYDKDPQMAADIANKIAELVDSTKNDMLHQRARQGFKLVEAEYNAVTAEIAGITDSLVKIGKLGVNDVDYQSQVLNQQLAISLMNNNKAAVAAIQKRLDILGQYGGIYMQLKNALEYKIDQATVIQAKYKQAKMDAESNLPQKFIVDDAYKAEKKSYPVRWLIVLVSTFSAFFLAVIFILVMERISAYKAHKRFNVG